LKVNESEILKKSTQFSSLCLLLVGATGLFAQTPQMTQVIPAHQALQNIAQLSARATLEVQQDLLTIAMSTTRDGSDSAALQTQLRLALEAALSAAKTTAQPGLMDVRTGNFSLSPRYGKDGKINGWQGTTELLLEGRDFPRITAAAGNIQTLALGQVGFALSREARDRVEGDAQAQAIASFKAKAAQVANSFGFTSYSLREVSINANEQGPVRPRMMAMQAKTVMSEAPIPVEAGKSSVTVNVTGSVQMK
jgi:predicted secreted protein